MTKTEAIAEIGRACGFVRNKDAEILTALLTCQEDLENTGEFTPWFLLTENSTKGTAVGEERVRLPLNFLRENEEDVLWILVPETGFWKPLTKGTLDDIRLVYSEAVNSTPQMYALDSLYFRLRPLPDKIYTLRMMYYAKDDTLNNVETNRWLTEGSRWLVGEAGQLVAQALDNASAYKHFGAMSARGKKAVYIKTEEMKHVNREYYVGS